MTFQHSSKAREGSRPDGLGPGDNSGEGQLIKTVEAIAMTRTVVLQARPARRIDFLAMSSLVPQRPTDLIRIGRFDSRRRVPVAQSKRPAGIAVLLKQDNGWGGRSRRPRPGLLCRQRVTCGE